MNSLKIGNYLGPSIRTLSYKTCVQALLCFGYARVSWWDIDPISYNWFLHSHRLELKRGDSSTKRVSFSQVSQATNTLQNSLLSLIFKGEF
jgi:hypothetical protein